MDTRSSYTRCMRGTLDAHGVCRCVNIRQVKLTVLSSTRRLARTRVALGGLLLLLLLRYSSVYAPRSTIASSFAYVGGLGGGGHVSAYGNISNCSKLYEVACMRAQLCAHSSSMNVRLVGSSAGRPFFRKFCEDMRREGTYRAERFCIAEAAR
jgi:hypothetical protein